MRVVTALDVLGIQRYVYASNRLRDVLAASWMVDHVTRPEQISKYTERETSSVLMAAGGNAIIDFASMTLARRWAACYSRFLHDIAPGLDVVVVHQPYEKGKLASTLLALQGSVSRKKNERIPGVPQLGLSVTSSCSITGLPATAVDGNDDVCDQVQELRRHTRQAMEQWKPYLEAAPRSDNWALSLPSEIDRMGRTRHESSFVGVVHVDGNSVGRSIANWLVRCAEEDVQDELVRSQYQEWSSDISEAGRSALEATVRRVTDNIRSEGEYCMLQGVPPDLSFQLYGQRDGGEQRTVLLPIRPVLLGGDDLTFLCDGRIALDLAVTALKELGRHDIRHLGEGGASMELTGCAGVALVKAHAPFYRSYELAAALCRRAKAERTANDDTGPWLDWHIGTVHPGESVEQLRQRAYARGSERCVSLTMRPYRVEPTEPGTGQDVCVRTWQWLDEVLLGPGPNGEPVGLRGATAWAGSRNRVKALSSAILAANGPEEAKSAVENQIRAWRVIENDIRLPHPLNDHGYFGSATPLIDAAELFDLHLRLGTLPAEPRRGTSAEGMGS